ncbi:hypothetical protein D3C85_1105620 [compost metagenome]
MNRIYFGRNVMGRVQNKPGEPLSFSGKVYARPLVTVAPVITPSGPAIVGAVLTYVPGTWLGFASINFQWEADGQRVQFSGPTYTVLAADVGKTITVLERAVSASGLGASSRSAGVPVS